MKVSCPRSLPSHIFSEEEAKAFNPSDLFASRVVPPSHYTQRTFVAYKKAESRNRRLKLLGNTKESFELEKLKPSLLAIDSPKTASKSFITSRFPVSGLSSGLERKISMLNAYHQLGELADSKPKRPVTARTKSASVRRITDRDTAMSMLRQRLIRDSCETCKRSICDCVKPAPDDYLERMGRLFTKARSTTQASGDAYHCVSSRPKSSRPQTSRSTTKQVPSRKLRPSTAVRATVARA